MKSRCGTWSIDEDGLRIAWMGMSEVINGVVQGSAVVVVGGPVMHGLAKVGSTWPKRINVVLRESELRIDQLALDAELRDRPPPQLLPLNAEPTDLLRLHVREAAEQIEEAGLDEAVAETLERLERSCASAATHLAWLGLSAGEIRAWVLGRHAEPASPPAPEFVVVEPSGQVRLFEGR